MSNLNSPGKNKAKKADSALTHEERAQQDQWSQIDQQRKINMAESRIKFDEAFQDEKSQ